MTHKLSKVLITALGFTLVSICALSLIITLLLYFEMIPVSIVNQILNVSSMLIFFVSACIAARMMESKGWLIGASVGLLFIGLTLLYRLIGIEEALNPSYFLRSGITLVICMAGGMIGINLPQKNAS